MSDEKIILGVLTEVLDELKKANTSLDKMSGEVNELEKRVRAFEQKEIKIEPPDLGPVSERVSAGCTELRNVTAAGLAKIAVAVEAQPKPIIRRISFFPENDREGNYKTFIRWLIGGTVGLIAIVTAFVLLDEWIQHRYPREMPSATSGFRTDVPSQPHPSPVPAPAKKVGTAVHHNRQKPAEKIVDTLKNKLINHLMDSVYRVLDSIQAKNGFLNGK